MIDSSKLNRLQKHIVELDFFRTGVVIGGPGTGKSLTMVLRAVHLVQSRRSVVLLVPHLASKRRLEKLLGESLNESKYQALRSTDILKKGMILTVSEFASDIISRVESVNSPHLHRLVGWNGWYKTQLVKMIKMLRTQGVLDSSYGVRQFHQLVMYLRSSDIDIQRARVIQNIGMTNAAIYKTYAEFTERERVFHVDDSTNHALYIIRQHNDGHIVFPSYQHILVDDAQDLTNAERNFIMLISQLTNPVSQLMMCVDDDQALLSYPRAAARYWISKYKFDDSHPIHEDDTTVLYSLTQNYRGTESYHNTVQRMLRLNVLRITKHTKSVPNDFLIQHVVEQKGHESVLDFQLLDEVMAWGKKNLNKEIAVIGRTSAQIRSFELTCLLRNVLVTYEGITPINRLPYISVLRYLFRLVVELHKPLQNRRSLLDHVLRVYLTPNDKNSLVIHELKRVDAQLSLNELFAHSQSWWQVSKETVLFEKYLRLLRHQLSSLMPAAEIIEFAFQFLRIDAYLRRKYGNTSEYAEHVLIVQQFIEYWTFLNIPANQIIEKWQDIIPKENNEESFVRIVLTTVEHASGHEFDAVVIPRMMDGYMPAYGCSDTVGGSNWDLTSLHTDVVERERRWCYVAMTRAKQAFFWSTSPSVAGVRVSQFVNELELVKPNVNDSVVIEKHFTKKPLVVVQNELFEKLSHVTVNTQWNHRHDEVTSREQIKDAETTADDMQLPPNENKDIQDTAMLNPNIQRFIEGSYDWFDVRKKIEQSFSTVQKIIDDIRNDRFEGFDRLVVPHLKRMNAEKIDNLNIAKQELFTTRIDYVDVQQPDNVEIMYVGAIGIHECDIVSWTSPLAGDLMYSRNSQKYGKSAKYMVQTKVEHNRLISMRLTYADSRALDESINIDWITGDQYLREILATTSRAEMRHIVQTIQYEQYQIIGAELAPFELVQGAPGTGKTSVALHRIAYIVANNKAISTDSVLLLGPNDVFFLHIKDVLPSLGVANIKSQSVRNWLKEVGVKFTKDEDQLLSLLFAERSNYMRVQKHFVSQHVITQVEILVDMVWRNRVMAVNTVDMSKINRELRRMYEEISQDIDPATKNEEIKKRRYSLETRLKNLLDIIEISKDELLKMYSNQFKRNVDGYKMLTDYLIEAMSRTIERIWQGMSIIEDLNWLINNQIGEEENKSDSKDRVKITLFKGIKSQLNDSKSRITENYKKQLNSVKQTDDIKRIFSYLKTNLAHDSMYRVINHDISQLSSITISKPASYEEDLLNHVITMHINGYKSKINYRTRYVVIDEAQDLNPMIYWILRKYMPNANIAAYGDMAQSIFRDVDGNMWDEFAVAAEFPSAKPLYLQTTYRSTKSVMALAERVLSKFPLPDYKYANAVMDSGIAPTIIQLTSHEMVMQYVLALKVSNPQFTYAIIFKKRETVEQFHDLCEKHNTQDMFLSVDNYQKDQSHSRITITYISKVKGLEFDVVIVADADDAEYPADSYHSRLLYVAISRAAKDLHIVYQHQLSELLR